MRRLLLAVVVGSLAVGVAVPSSGSTASPEARSSAKNCPTPRSFMVGPFFADQLRARNATCSFARVHAKRWGRTRDCVMPRGGPSDDVCRVRRWRCVSRQTGYETSKATCRTAGGRKAIGFRFGS